MGKGSEGIATLQSNSPVDQTVRKLEALLEAKGVRLFAVIDHGGEANRVGLHMRPAKLLIFGDPRAGTPIMIASPSAALDLPLKILVSEDEDGLVWISEVAHPGAQTFIVMIDGYRIGRFCLRLRLCASGEQRPDNLLAQDQQSGQ